MILMNFFAALMLVSGGTHSMHWKQRVFQIKTNYVDIFDCCIFVTELIYVKLQIAKRHKNQYLSFIVVMEKRFELETFQRRRGKMESRSHFAILLGFSVLLLVIYAVTFGNSGQTYRNPSPEPEVQLGYYRKLKTASNPTRNRSKTILFWNSYWHWTDFGMGFGNAGFVKAKCQFSNCYTTTAKSLLDWKSNKNPEVNAILFHGVKLNPMGMTKLKDWRLSLIRNGFPGPLFVLFLLVQKQNCLDFNL